MPFDTTNTQRDFENISAQEFGEYATYIPQSGSNRRVLVVRTRTTNAQTDLKGTTYSPARRRIAILVSQGGSGVPVVQVGADRVCMRLNPSDTNMRLFTVESAQNEYRVWRLGLLA